MDRISAPHAWRGLAACAAPDVDPEVFFAPVNRNAPRGWEEQPKRICRACAVAEKCFQTAVSNGITEGIWGGLTGWERHARGGPRPIRTRPPKTIIVSDNSPRGRS
ncbi:WhiB family transcriptional regulator [Streptomyces sp. NPDC007355]|uniref:WhiB family transcriptional regulator n=1 Tax=Streptomyces sp. NPDC007355 TaxID=3364778 RepID=UPI0036C577E7